MSKRLVRWDHRLQIQNLLWHLNGFPAMVIVTLGQQYNTGEKPTVMLYTYCSSERLNDLITVSSTWELTPVGTRYS